MISPEASEDDLMSAMATLEAELNAKLEQKYIEAERALRQSRLDAGRYKVHPDSPFISAEKRKAIISEVEEHKGSRDIVELRTVDAVKGVVQGVVPDAAALEKDIIRAIGSVNVFRNSVPVRVGYFIRAGNYFICMKHFFTELADDCTIQLASPDKNHAARVTVKALLEEKTVGEFIMVPLARVPTLSSMTSLQKKMCSSSNITKGVGAGIMVNGDNIRAISGLTLTDISEADSKLSGRVIVRYHADTLAGDCGSIVCYSTASGTMVVGLHHYGTSTTHSYAETFDQILTELSKNS